MANAFLSPITGRNLDPIQTSHGSDPYMNDSWNAYNPQSSRGLSGFLPSPGGSSWSPGVVHAPTINLNVGQQSPNEFSTVQNVKNPALQAAIDATLGQVNGVSTDFSKNPYALRTNVKDPEQQARIDAAGGQFDADKAANRQSLDEFTRNYLGADPAAKQFTNQETGAIGNIYGPESDPNSMAAHLAMIRRQGSIATAGNAQQALREALGQSKLNSLMGVNDSSVDQRLADAAARIALQQGATNTAAARGDYLSTLQAQTSMAGRRSALLDDYLKRGLVPADVRMRMGASELGQAGQLGQMSNLNNQYTLDSPEMMLQRRLGLLSGVQDADLRNNFYGLRKPYDPSGAGYYISDPALGGNGGGNYNFGGGIGTPDNSGLPPWAQAQRAWRARTTARGPAGANAGTGDSFVGDPSSFNLGFTGQYGEPVNVASMPGGGYNLSNNFMDYGDPRLQRYAPELYQPGYDPAQSEAMQQYYS